MKPPHSSVCLCVCACVSVRAYACELNMLFCLGLWCPVRKGAVGVSVDFLILHGLVSRQMLCEKSIPAGCDWVCDKGTDWASGCRAGQGKGAQS